MKKNISINISGIIFHIEEDGYETLKNYLESINKYFSSYEDSEEIVADIEGRIAEIFLEKLKDGNQVVSAEDVNSLIKTMGNISDFEAIEEQDDFESSDTKEPNQKAKAQEKNKKTTGSEHKKKSNRLYRDLQRRVLGGVAAGIANYYNFDPLWLRIGILFITFGLVFAGPIASLVFIAYFVLWAVTPGNDSLEEDKKIKKLYRDPEDRVVGGVSSGLANYFNIDTIIIRIIFIVLFFGFGTGLIAYIILWIITPSADSLTDKMQMKGEAVTLSNIDSNIKRSKEPDFGPKGEGTFTKVLLFPFRLIGKIFVGLGRAFAPLMLFIVAVIRILTGIIISTTALSVIITLIAVAGVLFGLYNGDWIFWDSGLAYFPIEIFQATVPGIGIFFLLVALFIPFLYLLIAGITIIAKKKVMSTAIGWSILGIWFIAILGTFATLPNIARDFRDEGIHRTSENFNIEADTITLKINEISYGGFTSQHFRWRNRDDDNYYYYNDNHYTSDFTDLDIRMSTDDQFKVEKRFRARGRDIDDAERNAQQIDYQYNIEDGKIIFDSELRLPSDAQFRVQELNITFYIPEGKPFKIERGMRNLMDYFNYGYSWWDVYRNTWAYQNGDLVCLTCENERPISSSSNNSSSKSIVLESFKELEISDRFKVNVIKGDTFTVEAQGSSNRINGMNLKTTGEKLYIGKADFRLTEEETADVELTITVPSVEKVRAEDRVDLTIRGLQMEHLIVWTFDESNLSIESDITTLDVFMSDESRLNLTNKLGQLNASLQKGSRMYAYDATIESANLETDNDSRARLSVSNELNVTARGFSLVRYKGSPTLNVKDKSNSATISKY